MIAFYGSQISDHMVKTPEGYLICKDVPINRTGEQLYTAGELQLDGVDPAKVVKVYREEPDVFEPAALASFEGKDVTQTHPPENLTPETQGAYSKGHVENVRRVNDTTVADLMIKDPGLISDVENGVMREVSCGYTCVYVPYKDGYKQTHIVGNHVAVVPKGRAGHNVAIKDAAPVAEKGRKNMNKFGHAILAAFGMAAKDATPEELDKLVSTAATALDAAPAENAPEAEPAKAEEETADVDVIREPKGTDIGSKIDELIAMVRELGKKNDREEKKLSDEGDLDEMIAKLAGRHERHHGDPEEAVTIPAEEMEDAKCGSMDSATIDLLKRVRPAVAGIQDPAQRARVVDALLSTVNHTDSMGVIMAAAQDSARKAADASKRTSYEAACSEAEDAYAARNPHIHKEV